MASIQKRPTRGGKIAYRALVRLKGYPDTSATFERLTDAKDWAQKTEAAMKERRYFRDSEAKKHTMAETIDRYLARTEKTNPKRHREIKPMLAWWKKEIGHCILADLTKTLLSEKTDLLAAHKRKLRNGKEKPRSAARVNRFLSALSHVFTIAVNEWEWLETHPMQKIKPMKEPRGRVRFLDNDERERLLAACKASDNPYLYAVVVLALSTGARLNEIMTLRWKDVDFERNTITLPKGLETPPCWATRQLAKEFMAEGDRVYKRLPEMIYVWLPVMAVAVHFVLEDLATGQDSPYTEDLRRRVRCIVTTLKTGIPDTAQGAAQGF